MADSTLAHEATIPLPLKGHDTAALGPSDSSDTGSDVASGADPDTEVELASDSDRHGTGERGTVGEDEALANDATLRVEDTDEVIHDAAGEDDGPGG